MEFYESGNDFYRSHDYHEAIARYSLGINHLQQRSENDLDHTTSELKKKLLLNRAQSYLNIRDYTAAVHDCTVILETLDDVCPKALIRRAIAYENCGHYHRGLMDIKKATTLSGAGLPASLADTATKLMTRLHALIKADEIAIAKEGRPDRMIHAHQTLRLNFNAEVPTEVNVEQAFVVHLCIGNEFGLWNRSHMQTPSSSSAAAASIVDSTVAGDHHVMAQVSLKRSFIDCEGDESTLSIVKLTAAGGSGDDYVGLDGKIALRLAFSFTHKSDTSCSNSSSTSTSSNSDPSSLRPLPTEAIAVLKFSLNKCLPSGVEVVPVLTLPIRIKAHPNPPNHGANSHLNNHSNHQPSSHSSNHPSCSDNNDLPRTPPHNTSSSTLFSELAHIGLSTQSSCIRECEIGLHNDDTLPSIFVLESPGSLGTNTPYQHTLSANPSKHTITPLTHPINNTLFSIHSPIRPINTYSQPSYQQTLSTPLSNHHLINTSN